MLSFRAKLWSEEAITATCNPLALFVTHGRRMAGCSVKLSLPQSSVLPVP